MQNDKGKPTSKSAYSQAWRRLMNRAIKNGVIKERFNLHDLKAKGVSDADHQSAGHRSQRMRDVYMRKAEQIKGTY
jgi:hypothetical protein